MIRFSGGEDSKRVKSDHGASISTLILFTNAKFINILSLPVEIVVYIISFLPMARDVVKLQYVSTTLRAVSKTPSLWSEYLFGHCMIIKKNVPS